MADKSWKRVEREVGKLFASERTGPLGEEWPDVISASFAIEVKHRARLPNWLKDAVDQAVRNGRMRAPHNLPIVILHEKGKEYGKSLVVVPSVDLFIDYFGT